MGKPPEHFPGTEVKLTYSERAIHVIFRVEDRYVRAVARQHQDPVCRDSCVEFFFTPDEDITQGYFNIEMNCGGIMLFHYQPEPRIGQVVIPREQCEKMPIAHTLPRRIEPEMPGPVTWLVEYTLPLNLLMAYRKMTPPAPGVIWRGNFYKCGDRTPHPHWLTWAPVTAPKPDFHRPECFGRLVFD